MQNIKAILVPFVDYSIPYWVDDPLYAYIQMIEYPYEKKKERKEDGQNQRAGISEEFGIPPTKWM